MMSVAVTDHEPSQSRETLTNAEHQSGWVPDEALASIMAAEVAEEFREFLLVIASQPQSCRKEEAAQAGINRK